MVVGTQMGLGKSGKRCQSNQLAVFKGKINLDPNFLPHNDQKNKKQKFKKPELHIYQILVEKYSKP